METKESDDKEIFREEMSDKLMSIYSDLGNLFMTRDSWNPARIDKICGTLDDLAGQARDVGEDTKMALLKKLSFHFYRLQTVGFADKPEKFENQAEHAFDLLETVLLALDGPSEKNHEKVLAIMRRLSD